MAEQTLADIQTLIEGVLEASPLGLTKTRDAFNHDRQPNTLLEDTYYIDDGGLETSTPMTNMKAARIDRLVIYVAAKLKFQPHVVRKAMQTTLLTAERYLKANGLANSYHVELRGRRVTRPQKSDFLIGSITISVDYDVNEATS